MKERRRVLDDGALIQVYEELKTVGSGTWVVPAGCTSVDIFVVDPGKYGFAGTSISSGAGGRGGYCKTYTGIAVTPGASINYNIGLTLGTWFMNSSSYVATTGNYASGGAEIGHSQIDPGYSNGKTGGNGYYAFGSTTYSTNRYGAGGGSGAAEANSLLNITIPGGAGGSTGGGRGGDVVISNNVSSSSSGAAATFYGGGGGGGGKQSGSQGTYGYGGAGYQGIIILRYYRKK